MKQYGCNRVQGFFFGKKRKFFGKKAWNFPFNLDFVGKRLISFFGGIKEISRGKN